MQVMELNNTGIRLRSGPGSLPELNVTIALTMVSCLQLWLALNSGDIILKVLGI